MSRPNHGNPTHSIPDLQDASAATIPSRPLVQCAACGEEPKDAVASPCCGDVWCWQCAVKRTALDTRCSCGRELALEDFRPAKAIQALLKRAATAKTTSGGGGAVWPKPDDLLPCPNGCHTRGVKRKDVGAHLRDDCPLASVPCSLGCDQTMLRREMEDHMKDNGALHLKQLQATVAAQKARIALLEEERQVANQAPPKHGSFLPHFSLRVKWVMVMYLVAVLVAVLAGVPLIGKLVDAGPGVLMHVAMYLAAMLVTVIIPLVATLVAVAGAMLGLWWGFMRWVGWLRASWSPFKSS